MLTMLTVTVLSMAIGGCGVLSNSAADERRPPEQRQLTLALLPIIDAASAYIAEAEGYFAEEGLDVEVIDVQGLPVTAPALTSGEYDIAFADYVSLFLMQSTGEGDFRIISDGYQTEENVFTIISSPQADLRGPADLAGRRLAVSAVDNIGGLTARSTMETVGVDPGSVQFVEMPFPEMLPALQNGQVDAAYTVEPISTLAALEIGAVTVVDAAAGPTAQIPVGGYGVTTEFAEQNPNTVAAFQRAMQRGARAASNRVNVEQILPTYSDITPNVAPLLNLGTWPISLSAARLQRVADLMLEFDVLQEDFDVSSMLLPAADG